MDHAAPRPPSRSRERIQFCLHSLSPFRVHYSIRYIAVECPRPRYCPLLPLFPTSRSVSFFIPDPYTCPVPPFFLIFCLAKSFVAHPVVLLHTICVSPPLLIFLLRFLCFLFCLPFPSFSRVPTYLRPDPIVAYSHPSHTTTASNVLVYNDLLQLSVSFIGTFDH